MEEIWITFSVGTIITIFATVTFLRMNRNIAFKKDAVLTLGTTLVMLGIIFGDDRLVGYPLIGVGVLLAIISAIM
jgi:hypothetical protein